MVSARAAILILFLTTTSLLAADVRVILDPALLAESGDQRNALVGEARRCLADLRALTRTPAARAHFHRVYRLDPSRLLERDDFAVVIRSFPRHAGRSGTQVGGYEFGESTLDLNVAVLRASLKAGNPSPWRRYAAGVLLHELAHFADYVDDGLNNDGGLAEEEGEAAQRATASPLQPPGALPDEGELVELSEYRLLRR